jgi:hypothetical protein
MNRTFRSVKTWRGVVTVAFVAAATMSVAGSGCGGSSSSDAGTDAGSDVSGPGLNTRLVDLSEAEAAALCDWVAGRFGGYGQGVTCGDGLTVSARQTRELCVMDYRTVSSTCAVTVGDIQACANQAVGPPVCATVPQICLALLSCV